MSSESKNSRSRAGIAFSIRLSLFYAAFFLIGFVAIFAAGDFLIRLSIINKEREIVSERIAEYRAWFLSGNVNGLRARFEEQSIRSSDLVFVRIFGPESSTLLFSAPKGQHLIDIAQLNQLAASSETSVVTLETANPRNIWTVGSYPLRNGLVLQAGKISTAAFGAVQAYRNFFLWAIIPVFLLALAGGSLISYRAMKPARDLTSTVRTILETGQLNQRVPIRGSESELAEMSLLCNRMLDRNQSLIQAMRDALDNVSHDLKTPMTRLRAIAENALSKDDSPGFQREALADCLEESERVLTMLNTLMDIAEAETGVMKLDREPVDLVSQIRQVLDLYELVTEESAITVTTALPDSLIVDVDRQRIQQAIANLFDNAVKYSHDGGKVRVSLEKDADEVVLRVADDGIGIPKDDLPRIWDRLYRGDRSRSRRGLGLGLSFVRAIVDAHGGKATVESQPGLGSTFTLRFPATASS